MPGGGTSPQQFVICSFLEVTLAQHPCLQPARVVPTAHTTAAW